MSRDRIEFESWVTTTRKNNGMVIELHKDGDTYYNPWVQAMWEGWLARAQLSANGDSRK